MLTLCKRKNNDRQPRLCEGRAMDATSLEKVVVYALILFRDRISWPLYSSGRSHKGEFFAQSNPKKKGKKNEEKRKHNTAQLSHLGDFRLADAYGWHFIAGVRSPLLLAR